MPKTNRILERILAENGDWLYGRARRLSLGLYGHDREADDIASEVVLQALELLRGGWMDERPRVNFTAQARNLLNICLMRVRGRRLGKGFQLATPTGEASADLEDRLPPAEGSPEIEVIRGQSNERLLAAIGRLVPSRRLAILALHLPHHVSEEVVEAAAAYHKGGGGLSRSGEEAWRLFRGAFLDRHPVVSDSEWRRIVAEILRGTGPLGSTPQDKLRRAVNALEVQVSNAFGQLLTALSQGEEP